MEVYDYFQSYEGYFWQWEEEGAVIAIPNGSTIAYKEFVIELLEKLSDQGIPPFSSLLLSIIATNPNAEDALNNVYALVDKKLGSSNSTREPLNSAIAFLKLLSQLPKKYKEGKNRLLLLQTLFSNCHNIISAAKSEHILDFYKANKQKGENFLAVKIFRSNAYNKDFKVISLLANRFPDVKTIIEKLADLPVIGEELQIEGVCVTEVPPKDFIKELIDHDKTFHIGSLIKRLWSGLNIPYHNILPSQQPMGGVSDLTNKGDFDRLLISEFANDDLVFLSRLANNEALYINREVPPQNNNLERIILIDVSIKNWGTPKAIAHALLLAIAKHPKTDIHCSAFAVGNSYYPLAFDTIDDVIAGLQVLEPGLHPAQGLATFFKEYSSKKNREVFFISSNETFRQPHLHKAISDHYSLFNYWIYTDAKGNIDLYKRQQNSKKHVQHILLPLEALWKKAPAINTRITETINTYPLLFPGAANPRKVLHTKNGEVFLLTAEKNLIRSLSKDANYNRGWEMVYENLPFTNGEAAIGLMENGEHVLLLFNVPNRELTFLNLNTGIKKMTYFTEWRSSVYKQFLFHNERFYYAYLGYPSKHWTLQLEEEIVIHSFDNIPKELTDRYKEKEEESTKLTYHTLVTGGILKNVTSVFINEVNNLVFNIHELRLKDQNVIKLEKTGFLKKQYVATVSGKNEFSFTDGSTVTINRSGLLILKSSDPSSGSLYVPSVLDTSLGVASQSDFAGNTYFQLPVETGRRPISTTDFWHQYMEPFIDNIKNYGA